MRVKYNLFKRMKLSILCAFKNKNARVMTCGNCGKTDIIPISNALEIPHESELIKADIMYVQYAKCRTCGAVCKEIQLWNNSGNIQELDKQVNQNEKQET